MKIISTSVALLAACLALCCAEAPAVDQRAVAAPAPYPASGWKPSGRLLLLPLRQQEAAQQYHQPDNQYGPPEQISAAVNPNTSTQAGESDNDSSFPASQQQPRVTSGVYHVLLPDGRLQRVEFTTAPLNSEAAQTFTSSLQYQQQESKNNDFNQQYQPHPQDHTSNYQIQQSQNFEGAAVQKFAFPGALFPQTNEQAHSAKFTQGQSVGQSAFQKPSFQQNQFGLNTFQQSQSQLNHFGLNSFQQKPVGGKYQQGQGQNSQQQDSFSASGLSLQQKQYLSPESSISAEIESQNSFNQHNTFQQTQNNADISSGKVVNAQQSGQTETETVPPSNTGTGFVANVQYKDVEPIPGPIYSYNPAPLVRILRKTE